MRTGFHPREQGDFGELSAVNWLREQGAYVFLPFGHCPDFDLVACLGDEVWRIEVKTSTNRVQNRWETMVRTCGGNQSWTGTVKHFDPRRCDYLFVHAGDGCRWFIPTSAVGGGTSILLGGPKYAAYEVSRGKPLLRTAALAASV